MSEKVKLVRVFIASPGGLTPEREIVRDVANEINRINSKHWKVQIHIVGWEDTTPGFQRPQSKINDDLDICEYFLGIIWNRWGTKPTNDDDGPTSGFEEEYLRAKQHVSTGKMKDLTIYFKQVEVPIGMEPGPDIRKVLEFREICISEKKFLFGDFKETEEFRSLIRSKLSEIGWNEAEKSQEVEEIASLVEAGSQAKQVEQDQTEQTTRLIEPQAATFLSQLVDRTSDWDETKPFEIARLRLIASSVFRSGNDEDLYLGNHDANLVYKHRNELSLSHQEVRALIDCGVAGFSHQNVPLWHWVDADGALDGLFSRIRFLILFGSPIERKNSIEILRLAEASLGDDDTLFGRKSMLKQWFADDTNSSVTSAATDYLSELGEYKDIEILEEIKNSGNSSANHQIETAIVAILSRHDVEIAIKRAAKLQTSSDGSEFIKRVFANPNYLRTATLIEAADGRNDTIRLCAVRVLAERQAITNELAKTLITDSIYEIRYLAAESLYRSGEPLSDETLNAALTSSQKTIGFLSKPGTSTKYLQRFQGNRLSELSFSDLTKETEKAGIFNTKELIILYNKYPKKLAKDLRENLKDGFVDCQEKWISSKALEIGYGSDFLEGLGDILPFLRQQLTSSALSALCCLMMQSDLPLVRNVIDKIPIWATPNLILYLKKFGDWSDLERVLKLEPGNVDRVGLIDMTATDLTRAKAEIILKLGRNRLSDIFGIEINYDVWRYLISRMPTSAFVSLPDSLIIDQLNNKHDDYRVLFAQKCVLSLTKSRINTLLERYVGGDNQRFYNSIHWLDLASSLPSVTAKAIAQKAMAKGMTS